MNPSSSDRAVRVVAAFAPSCLLATACAVVAIAIPSAATAQGAPPAAADPIFVTANRLPQPLSSVLADVSVLTRDDIERAGAADVADLLARLPGVEFSRSGGPAATTGVFIRGAESRFTAVYLDGVRVDSQTTGGAAWEQIPLQQIDRIEVLRGPAAAVYGSDAAAGVVQLFTRRGQGAARPSAALTVGSYGTVQGQAGVSGASGALDYALSAAHGRSTGFDSRTAAAVGHNPDRDGWTRSSATARLGWQIDPDQRLEASLLASRLRSGYDGFMPDQDEQNMNGLRSGSLTWQARWSGDATTRLQLGRTRSTYESEPDYYRTETTLDNVTLLHEQRLAGQWLSVTLERLTDALLNPPTAYTPLLEGKRHQDAVGLGWRADFGNHGLRAQLRHDRDSEFGGKSTGSLAWGWAFMPQWRLTASAATSFRAPTLYQRFSSYGNAALVPESGRNVELGLRWADAASEVSLNVWRNRVADLIGFGAPGPCADAYGCYVNVGSARLDGATLAARTRLAGVTLRGSYDHHDPFDGASGKLLPRRARELFTFGAEGAVAGWTIGTEVQGAGKRYDDAANTQPLGGYGLVNLYASKALAEGFTLDARIDNLANKRYELAQTYATAGRNAQLTLRWAMP